MRDPFSRLSTWYFSKKSLPYWGIILLDCCLILFSGLLVYTLNNGVLSTLDILGHLLVTLLVCLIPYLVGFRLFHTYSGIIRYSSFVDLQKVGFAVLFGLICVVVFQALTDFSPYLVYIRKRDLILSALLAMSLMWMMRVFVKYFYVSTFRVAKAERAFIYGVKQGGVSLAKSIQNQDPARFVLAGFISDMAEIGNRYLMGVKVYPNNEDLIGVMRRLQADVLLVSPLKVEAIRNNQEMVDRLIKANIKIYMTPAAQEWDGKSDLSHTQLREVNIEDLLPRDKIEIDLEAVRKQLTGKRILITGAAGSIGSEIVRQVAQFAPERMVLIDQAETPLHDVRLMMARQWSNIESYTVVSDICVRERMEELFEEHRPDYVFHAAAYKHVPMMEDNPEESVRNNVDGTRVIADLAVKYGTRKFVMVSTDKAVNPTNVMGCSKRICEIYVQSLDQAIKDGKVSGRTQFVTTRFGNVLGSNGSVIPLFKEQIKRGGPVTVTHKDIIRFFMLIPEACKLVLEAGTMGNGGEIFVFDMGKPVRIVDLAERMIRLSGVKGIEIRFTGLRDGEKLYEEVLNEEETSKPTFHPKIKIAQVRAYDYADANLRIDALVHACAVEGDMQIVKRMKEIVPEFKSQHSKYEVLDK
ncbi:polysaccharide biosynthesis family protein [Parabacteroides distasonis str. 3776 D15 iv]|uniref:Polysaccharide biosynthesis family protein n=1 Tax=Parabacteroides distasonis str. 3776 D15 i TaxID=1339342 RepID=A0AB34LIW2_PARDI|nr:nucleoside-diphosphate sugar epimerase/dehydratase [Parabacteroides distasonis]KDS39766.1 polysaccharide biosynthesis family protein [Parabacteroides distasonis str. 3776 D15 i]KDS42542.1 polysaccharide biosynthesis family protein [Parabacteroides distasonis str. 3776 Po2 i]KDS69961.1 polysaccharide biosynthesis family protein [Parabacteroides distasonis str. 3776 D15 iv]